LMLPDLRTPEEFLADAFAERRERALANPPEDVEELLLTALPILFDFLGRPAPAMTMVRNRQTPEGRQEPVVQILNQPHPTSVVNRLKKIEQTWNPDTDPPLILVRDARRTISQNAKKTREVLDRLTGRGAVLAQPSAEVLAALEALRSLHADAQSGNLVHRGETVTTGTLKQWFSANPPSMLEDFLDELKPKPSESKDQFVNDLLDFLEVHSIVKLEEAAEAIHVPPQQLADYASHHPVTLGYLAGPPPVLFRAVPGRAGDPREAD